MMDETTAPTIKTALHYLAFLLASAGCFYLFLLGAAGEFGERETMSSRSAIVAQEAGR